MTTSQDPLLRKICYLTLGLLLVGGSFLFGLWIAIAYFYTLRSGLTITFLLGVIIGSTPAMVSLILVSGFYTKWDMGGGGGCMTELNGDSDGGSIAAAAAVIVVI